MAVVSPFTIMEAIEERQEVTFARSMIRRGFTLREIRNRVPNRKLTPGQRYRCFRQVHQFLESLGQRVIIRPIDSPEFWRESSRLVQSSSMSAPDAIHVVAAISTGCDVMVTGDEQLRDQIAVSRRLKHRLPTIFVKQRRPQAEFAREMKSVLSALRQKYRVKPKRGTPEEFRRFVSVLGPVLGGKVSQPRFIENFEAELRGGESGEAPKRAGHSLGRARTPKPGKTPVSG